MATEGTSSEKSPTSPSKRERKPNIRLGDLGEYKPSSKPSRTRNRRSTDPSPDSETPDSDSKRSKPSTPRSTDPSPDSGTDKQTETPDSEPKRSKPSTPRSCRSTEPYPDSGTGKQTETPDSDSKRLKRSRPRAKPPADNSGTANQMEMPISLFKRPRDKPPANNSGPDNQVLIVNYCSNSPARAMICDKNREVGPIVDINVSGGAHDVAAKGNDCISQNGGSRLAEIGGVHGWLERLGLAKYKRAFDLHEVDETALPLLTLDDLRDMEITAVGSRRKLYCAIQELKKGL